MSTITGFASETIDERALQTIATAADAVASAKAAHDADVTQVAEAHLRVAVRTACDEGVTWQSIGNALGMRRGAAYQRFRRKPRPATKK